MVHQVAALFTAAVQVTLAVMPMVAVLPAMFDMLAVPLPVATSAGVVPSWVTVTVFVAVPACTIKAAERVSPVLEVRVTVTVPLPLPDGGATVHQLAALFTAAVQTVLQVMVTGYAPSVAAAAMSSPTVRIISSTCGSESSFLQAVHNTATTSTHNAMPEVKKHFAFIGKLLKINIIDFRALKISIIPSGGLITLKKYGK
jgi:hypothetical protein